MQVPASSLLYAMSIEYATQCMPVFTGYGKASSIPFLKSRKAAGVNEVITPNHGHAMM
jgi:hypothetical protein